MMIEIFFSRLHVPHAVRSAASDQLLLIENTGLMMMIEVPSSRPHFPHPSVLPLPARPPPAVGRGHASEGGSRTHGTFSRRLRARD